VTKLSASALRRLTALSLAAGVTILGPTPASATEGGASLYLLGAGGPGAAELPPVKGIFFDNTTYYLSGNAGGGREFVIGGAVVAGLKVNLPANFTTLLWVPSTDFLGATVGLAAILPIGRPDVNVDATLTGPRGNTISLSAEDRKFIVGDPVTSATLSWPIAKNTKLAFATTLNIPVGHYREGELANLAFHRGVVDNSLAITWRDPKAGWDLSGKLGITFNGTNHFTHYDSGNELHVEASVERIFSPKFSAGLQMYHLQQLTDDSGSGARLGAFKGRTTGVGPTAAVNFTLGKTQVTARVRVFQEFAVENRPKSTTAFLSLTVPLKMWLPPATPAQ
jgi:hypothetical protein